MSKLIDSSDKFFSQSTKILIHSILNGIRTSRLLFFLGRVNMSWNTKDFVNVF